jgi:hypothetical protein
VDEVERIGILMEYSQPTLFGVAYASRLFREIDFPSNYEYFVKRTPPTLDLGNECHALELLKWLNIWGGCRINKDHFPGLCSELGRWFAEARQKLPPVDIDIAGLEDFGFVDELVRAYEALRKCGLGPTAAGKALFAVRPRCAIPWDEPIRTKFGLRDECDGYRKMLQRSREEANILVEDANRYKIADIPRALRSAVPSRDVATKRKDLEAALASAPVCWTSSSAKPRYLNFSADDRATTKAAIQFPFAEVAGMLIRTKMIKEYTYWELAPVGAYSTGDTGGEEPVAEIDSPARLMTLAKLLDEYHWITITRGHQIPSPDELERWVSWQPRREKTVVAE